MTQQSMFDAEPLPDTHHERYPEYTEALAAAVKAYGRAEYGEFDNKQEQEAARQESVALRRKCNELYKIVSNQSA